jgi:hypothetical protein
MAAHLIFKGQLEVIPTDLLEMEEAQGSCHFQISKGIFTDMTAGPAGWAPRLPHWGSGGPSNEASAAVFIPLD